MTESDQLIQAFDDRARRRSDRREMFRMVLGAAAVGGAFAYATPALAQTAPTEADVLNFALNLEYLEANFYSYAAFGVPIEQAPVKAGINGTFTSVSAMTAANTAGTRYNEGAHAVKFTDPVVAQYAREIALDEIAHVNFLRTALGASAVGQPVLDVGITPTGAFSTAARAAGLIGANTTAAPTFFDPYSSDLAFLYGAFIFEDVGVTAYKGSASLLINNKTYVDAAAGILAAEAYHASIVRTSLDAMGGMAGLKATNIRGDTELVSNARDSLDGATDLDQGINQISTSAGVLSNIAPTDGNGLVFSRTANQVLNIVYLNNAQVSAGGFFPNGVNGTIKASAANNA